MDDKPTIRDWLGIKRELDFTQMKFLGGFIAFVLGLLMIAGLIIAVTLILRLLGTMVGFPILGQTDTDVAIRNLGLAVVAIFSAPFLAWRTMIAQNQANTAEQGHITDRINTAVQGLGAEKTVKRDGEESTEANLEVRIGATYALERIAQDSDRDHIQIMEILCAYIRQNAPAKEAELYPFKEDETPDRGKIHEWVLRLATPRNDIQIALEIIGRRNQHQIRLERAATQRGHEKGYRLDLRNANLQKADMAGLNFEYAKFNRTILQGANLLWAELQGADLRGAELQGANLLWAKFDASTNLTEALLRGASVRLVDLTNIPISADQINAMFGDASVTLPADIPRPDHWPTEKLDLHAFLIQWRDWQKSIGFTLPENKS